MSELIALFVASMPVVAILALVVLTLRAATDPGVYPPVDLLHRAYGA